jgi:phosphoribosylaminoimidazole-succinocarboxamide synthase
MPLLETGLPDILYRGKVRDTYDLGDGLLLMVATDRISAFDVVLPNGIPDKGYVLSRLSVFWFDLTQYLLRNHLVAMADDTVGLGKLASHPRLQSLPAEIARQAMVVRRARRLDVECVVRGYITGSAWAEYKERGTIAGLPAPTGLREGDKLPETLFTPTTKAEVGHDENISMEEVARITGQEMAERLREASFILYRYAHDYALERGIILADTKMEFGTVDGELTLIDELFTPDSSRFWDVKGYAPGQSQPNFDKQFVRDWLLGAGWDREPPAPALPDDVVAKTRERYLEAYELLVGRPLPV